MQRASNAAPPPPAGFNLLRIAAIRRLVLWGGFPALFQSLVLAVYLTLAVIGWGHLTPTGVNAKLYAKTNIVNLVIWGLWWPAIIWVTVFLGRAWCTVCPLELVSSLAERAGRNLGLRQRPLGGWLAKGALAVCLFALMQLLVPGIQIHRMPHYTSLFLWASLAAAVIVGLLFKDRAFCRGFCPVSLLLNAYGRGGMIAVRAGQHEAGSNRGAHLCPSLLNPPKLNSNRDCLVCGQCVRAGAPDDMQLLLRAPFSAADAREPLASWPLTLFVMVVSGFVTFELCGVWKAAEPVFLWAPKQASAALNAGAAAGWIQGLWTIALVPLLLWIALGLVTRAAGGAASFGEAWRRLALPMAVVVAAGHMSKGLEKFTSWAGFLPHALREPTGVNTALQMNAKAMPQPAAWLSLPVLSAVTMTLIVVALLLAIREARLADPAGFRKRLPAIALLSGSYLFLVFGWGGWLA
ncbi:MAG: 4Fe-4S binding protein [Verrucomicrobia bacterium]|nr:4Fe-4S binding protein [Verrucomicrobiota bacterium]